MREKQFEEKIINGQQLTDSSVLSINNHLFELKKQKEDLIRLFENQYPEYYHLRYSSATLDVSSLQEEHLSSFSTLLEYFVGDSQIFVFVITKETLDVKMVKKDFPLDSLVQTLQNGLFGYLV